MRALMLLQPVGYDRPVPVAEGVDVDFINAGHLLGSSYARLRVDGKTLLFGGDLGRFERCAGCELLRFCRGCPAVAAATSGSFYAPDPQCWKDLPMEGAAP